MPRNQSEKAPVLIAEKRFTPACWNQDTPVFLFHMPDQTWRVAANWSSDYYSPRYRISTFRFRSEAQKLYDACEEELLWADLDIICSEYSQGHQPLAGTGFRHEAS